MKIIINSSSMVPIYEQIVDQVKARITAGDLGENDVLPSVRTLAKDLKISALTVKKAYDNLEQEGYTVTVHGKGTFVAAANTERLREAQRAEVEADLEAVLQKARRCGLSDGELRELFEMMMEEQTCWK
ncbi:MAG TPA: GntR family transcriptional regulator [Candidatus Mediterraneibacter merdipullorum]|nr:GntR family transcriptional regulator [Candidatus Mediterraneibacter merdipullorum]